MRNILILIAYDGTAYCGWQVQKNGVSVASRLIEAIRSVSNQTVKLNGSGRTDAGVHAHGQTATFRFESKIPAEKLPDALNAKLPDDIRVLYAEDCESDFHARFDAKGKRYEYLIYNRYFASPFMRERAWHIRAPLDLDKMRAAAEIMCGTHDFAAYMASGSFVTDTVRTIYELSVSREAELIRISVSGSGFLYNMVRIIAGTLVYAGLGKMNLEQVRDNLLSLDRTTGAITAPPYGLYLCEVYYDREKNGILQSFGAKKY